MPDLTLLTPRPYPLWSLLVATALFAGALSAYEPVNDVPPDFKMPEPLSLEDSVASLKTRPGLRVELVAAEPLVKDPINLDWGPDGKLWVVEMTDYPLGIDGKGTPGGRVRFLEDKDADGRYETSTVFLEGLNYPTSVKAWKNGVLVIACPEIIYAEDTDGDGRADKREVLYLGFREGNQQHRVNGLEWSLDGWLVIANGDSGGTVESVKTGEKLELGSFDLRIHPDSGGMELLTGRTQYGRARDNFDNWFGCSNSRPFFYFSLKQKDLLRNPHVIYPAGNLDIDGGSGNRRVYPTSQGGQRYNNPDSENWFTSACGLAVYRDDRLDPGFANSAFVCEPVHNLVHRRRLETDGVSFRAVRVEDETDTEFLTSTDHWFRPTSAKTGPDGGLWVVDMHRYVIEHPEWIPEPWRKVLDLRAGHERGRIYRVVSDECDTSMVPKRLDSLSTSELIAELKSSNGWRRDTAHRLLIEHGVKSIDPAIMAGWFEGSTELSKAHLLGFFGEGKVPSPVLFDLLTAQGPSPLQALALGLFRAESATPPVLDAVIDLANRTKDLPIARASAAALGQIDTPEAGATLAQLALAHGSDPLFTATAMSSLVPHLDEVATATAAAAPDQQSPLLPYLMETAVALKRGTAIAALLNSHPENLPTRFRNLAALLSVLDRRKIDFDDFASSTQEPLSTALTVAANLATEARQITGDPKAPVADRIGALTLLGRGGKSRDADINALLTLFRPEIPAELQLASARRLLELGALGKALAIWKSLGPGVRGSLISGSLSDRKQVAVLLTAIENGTLPASAIDAASRERLLTYPQSQLKEQAKTVLGAASNPDRAAVIAKFSPALEMKGNPDSGRTHFQTLCAVCHQLGGLGSQNIGADLAALADKSFGTLLTAILDPNRAVEDKYALYQVDLNDGGSLAGLIAAESGDSLTLQLLDGSRRDLLRTEVKALTATGRSAMPEGLEAALDPQSMADLILFIQKPEN